MNFKRRKLETITPIIYPEPLKKIIIRFHALDKTVGENLKHEEFGKTKVRLSMSVKGIIGLHKEIIYLIVQTMSYTNLDVLQKIIFHTGMTHLLRNSTQISSESNSFKLFNNDVVESLSLPKSFKCSREL